MFIQALDVGILHRGLEQRVQHMKAGFVGGKPSSRNFHAAETAHIGAAVGQARPRAAPVFHLDHLFGGVLDKILHHILFAQPVAARNGVVEVVFERVVVAHHAGRTALRRHGVAAHRINFGNQVYGFVGCGACDFNRRPQACTTCAHYRHIGLNDVHFFAFCCLRCFMAKHNLEALF